MKTNAELVPAVLARLPALCADDDLIERAVRASLAADGATSDEIEAYGQRLMDRVKQSLEDSIELDKLRRVPEIASTAKWLDQLTPEKRVRAFEAMRYCTKCGERAAECRCSEYY